LNDWDLSYVSIEELYQAFKERFKDEILPICKENPYDTDVADKCEEKDVVYAVVVWIDGLPTIELNESFDTRQKAEEYSAKYVDGSFKTTIARLERK
jgi:hypothetical protein